MISLILIEKLMCVNTFQYRIRGDGLGKGLCDWSRWSDF
jgi:hypothetical protein